MQRMKNISSRLVTFQKKALCLAVAAAFSQATIANPLNPTVAAGSATFVTNGNTLTVTNTPNAIINWQQFNINQNETTRFVQQSAQSAVLNRIGGQNASQILGTLSSNGRVFLVNPNGVMFGQGAVIDVAGLVASSLNLSDANFLANKLNFSGGGFGAVSNLGNISTPLGGSVYLIGNNVTNQGVITTPQGQVLLAAGSSVSLVDTAGPELSVTLTANGNKAINIGTVNAEGGRIDMFGALIEQQGVLRANVATVDDAGRIVLKATEKTTVSGEISATNSVGNGGQIQVLGKDVTLTSTAKIDVSGVGAGGTALIGGDYKGQNAAIQNAQQTTIEQGATIKADALDNGNGGKVIAWADDKAIFDGYISARGGANGGDGGFVETSGKNTLSVHGGVNTLAPKGKTGNWLLDPTNFCLKDVNSTGCAAGATWLTAADISNGSMAVPSGLNSTNVTLEASSAIDIYALNFTPVLTRWGSKLTLKAPTITQYDTISSLNNRLSLEMQATDIRIVGGNFVLGNTSVAGNLHLQATSEIKFENTAGTTITGFTGSGPQNWFGSSDITLAAPKLVLLGDVTVQAGFPNYDNGNLMVITDRISGDLAKRFIGHISHLWISTYSSNRNIYFGKQSSDPLCQLASAGGNGLCLTNQFASQTSGLTPYLVSGSAGIMASSPFATNTSGVPENRAAITDMGDYITNVLTKWAPPTGDIYIGYDTYWSVASKNSFGLVGKNVTINAGKHINAAGWSTSIHDYIIGIVASNTFTNLGNGIINLPTGKHWGIAVGNLAGSTFGPFADGALNLTLRDAVIGPNAQARGNPNFIIDMNLTTADGLCSLNPSACTTTTNPLTVLNETRPVLDTTNTAAGTLTVSGDLKIADNSITRKTDIAVAKEEKPDATGKPATTGKDDKSAKEDDKKKVAAARQEAKASEEKKSSAELKREAQTLKADGKKIEAEARKTEADAKKVEAEAKKSETETKKVEVEAKKVEAVAKKAEETGKKAEVEAKKHDSDAKQAANEAKEAKTPVAKANAESKKAEAESKKADADSKKVEAEEKKVAAEGKKSEVEHKKAETESKHKEAESKHKEAESKKAEADSKQAEADSKIALAEAKEAKTPQQKAAAEKRADEKRVEAIQKKAEANVKKDQADVKKTEVDAKKAESEHKKIEAEAKKTEADSKRAEGDAKKSESSAKKAESEGKKAEADSAKAKQEGKGADEKKAESKKQEAEQKKAQEEKKVESKKQEAEQKKAEADRKLAEAEKKKIEAETKRVEAEKKQAERRQESIKAFARSAVTAMAPERAAQMLAVRHEFKTETLKPALSILERNPAAANMPACGGGSDVCVPAKATSAQQIAQIASQLPTPRIPTVSFLPQIERKIAVVVAINNYKDGAIPPLESAIPDGDAIGKVMADNLGYDVRVIRDGSKADIVKSLNAVSREVGPNDSVTVYYAGHGYQMPDKSGKPGEGYWIPSDGSARSPDNWISNSDVSKLLANIPAKQVMLVSDSCYSGAFAKEQKVVAASNDPQKLLANRSVVVMSSGGEEPVSDEGKDGHSIFAWSLMQTLKNVDKFETGGQLYEGIRKMVVDEFPQVPQYGAASSAGHVAGGDYLFESRKY